MKIAHKDLEGNEFAANDIEPAFSPICSRRDVEIFIRHLHELASTIDGELLLTSITDLKIRNFTFAVGNPEEMIARAFEEAGKPSTNLYFGSYVLRRGAGQNNRRGKLEDIIAVLMLGVDQDADHQREGTLPVEPNLIIRTSETPLGNGSRAINRQAFYIFDPANRPTVTEAAELGRALRKATGADAPTGDVVRLFRLPGTLNWPTESKIERGRPPKPQLVLVEQEPTGFVDLGALRRACANPKEVTRSSEGAEPVDLAALLNKVSPRLRDALNRHDIDGDRSRAAWYALTIAPQENLSDPDIEALVLAHPNGVGERYQNNQISLRAEIARARAKADCSSTVNDDSDDLPSGLRRAADGGLLYRRSGNGKDDDSSWVRLCSPIWVMARARDHEGNNWGRLVELLTPTHEKRQLYIAASDLHVTSGERDPLACLAGAGLEVYDPGERSRLRKVLAHPVDQFARIARRTGWHDDTFVLPEGAINSASSEIHIWDGDESHEHAFRSNGSLEEWQSQVAKLLETHPLLLTAVSMAFVGPCLRLTDCADDFGVHLYGPSSRGKTTAMDIAASVWGSPETFSRTWRGTSNGFESIAAARNDVLLVLDELKQVSPQDLAQTIYMLAQGRGKQRANRSGDARRTHEWRLAYLSSGEISIADHLGSVPYQKPMAGQHVRCLEIALPDGGHGVFRTSASSQEAAELARDLKRKARSFYGTAGPAFISRLSRDLTQARERLNVLSAEFNDTMVRTLPELVQADGQVQRALGHFCLIYAAGALACEVEVLPFSATCIEKAVKHAFEDWVSIRGGYGSFEEERALTAIREFIELHASRFQAESTSEYANPLRERAGVQVKKDGQCYYAFLPGVWRNEVCQGQNAKAVAKIAQKHGFLEPEYDALGHVTNLQRKVTLDGRRVRAYLIKATILGEQTADRPCETTKQLEGADRACADWKAADPTAEDDFEARIANFLN
jgi:putative DNA primase/helicase